MFGPDTPKIVSRFCDILAALESALTDRFSIHARQAAGERALVFMHDGDTPLLYVGAWYELWSRSGFPLWYGVHEQWDAPALRCFMERHPEAVPFEGYRLCRLDCAPVFEDGPAEPVVELVTQELAFLKRS